MGLIIPIERIRKKMEAKKTKDYIEREAVLLHLNDIWLSATPTDTMYDDDRQLAMVRCMGLNDAMDVVKEAPAADVRPVVTCSDCKWWTKQESSLQGRCELLQMYPTGAWFCANGKREES